MYHDAKLTFKDTEGIRGCRVVNFVHTLHFNKMIAGAERARLRKTPFPGPRAYKRWVGAFKSAAVLDSFDILRSAITA